MTKQTKNNTDIAGILAKVQDQLTALEKKVDVLVSRLPAHPSGQRPQPPPASFPRDVVHAHPDIPAGPRTHEPPRARQMHKAVCADCKKDCEIPFKPTGDRPVYCKECFTRRKASRTLHAPAGQKPLNVPSAAPSVPAAVEGKKTPVKAKKTAAAARKPAAKKKPAPKKKK